MKHYPVITFSMSNMTLYDDEIEDRFLIEHYLLGNVDWSQYDESKWNKQHTFHRGSTISAI